MSSNLDVVRGVYSAFAAGDIPAVLGALAPSVEWSGFAAVAHEFVADGSTVVALGEYSGTYKATG